MKILDQYLYAIGRKLPYNARTEIIQELKSSLMDSLEDTYGSEPSPDQVEALIKTYGSPRDVANRYKEANLVIGSAYTDLYFFIVKIIAFALTIAFSVLFVIGLFSGDFFLNNEDSKNIISAFDLFTYDVSAFNNVLIDLVQVIVRVLLGTINAVGWLTLVFIILTRINNDQSVNLDEDWTPADLKGIEVGPEGESRLESAISIFFLLTFTVVINAFPSLVSTAEEAFSYSGLLDHNISIELFRIYLIPISIVWLTEVIYHIANLFYGSQSRILAVFKLCIDAAGSLVMLLMLFDTNLYMNYTGFIGFRTIFALISVISIFELIDGIRKFIRYYVFNQ